MHDESACPLCQKPATRSKLKGGDGYLYTCSACGGQFAIGQGAYSHAQQGELHGFVVEDVRRHIAEGKIPRVEFDGAGFSVIGNMREA